MARAGQSYSESDMVNFSGVTASTSRPTEKTWDSGMTTCQDLIYAQGTV